MKIVKRSSVFPASAEDVFRRLQKLETLQYIARPYATFTPADGKTAVVWQEGALCSFYFKLFGCIPFGLHTIQVERFDPERGILTHESNRHVPIWQHEITLEQIDQHTTRYTDIVQIEAGWKTAFVSAWATLFYAHRQRKWISLLQQDA